MSFHLIAFANVVLMVKVICLPKELEMAALAIFSERILDHLV